MSNSLYDYLIKKCDENNSAHCYQWNNTWYTRKDFLRLIHFLIERIKNHSALNKTNISYYGVNHPVAMALPFACSFLKLKYFALPQTTPYEKVQELSKNLNINLIFSTETIDVINLNVDDFWSEFQKETHANLNTQIACSTGNFYIGFLTSGSTGKPKVILIEESHILTNIQASIVGQKLSDSDIVLAILNICHSGGLCIQVLPALCSGARLILHKKFELNHFANELTNGLVSVTLIVPSFMRLIHLSSYWHKNIFSRCRIVGIGSANLDPRIANECINKKIPLINIYGSTEAGPFAIYGNITDEFQGFINIGKPALGVEAKLSYGDHGKLYLRGHAVQPFIFDGTDQVSLLDAEGWFDTGDETLLKNDQYYFTNRVSDIANIGGLKVNILEVENRINTIDGIITCAVFSRSHKIFNQVLVACVESELDHINRKFISARCKEILPRHMVPRNIYILKKLPRSSVGKILKSELKKIYG